EAFSRRRQQAEAWREEEGLPDTAAARQVAVLATRSPKQDHPLVELEVEWRHRADQVGLTADRVVSVMGRSRQVTPADPLALFDSLGSPDGLTAQASTFAQPEVVKEIAAALPEGGTRDEIEALAEKFLNTRDVVPVLPGRDVEPSATIEDLALENPEALDESPVGSGVAGLMRRRDGKMFPGTVRRLYTTVELLTTEQRIIEQAIAGMDAGRWVVPHRLVEARLRRHRHLTDGQREMVRSFATSGNTVDIGIGPAGTGKTAVMAVISQLAALTGTPILGAALAARAAAGLQTATGIRSTSLTRLLSQTSDARSLPPGVVVVVDEAGMVGTRQLAAVSDLVEQAEGKLILIGDDRQLPEIDAGGLFRALTNRLPAIELTENMRQRDGWERTALAELRDGSVGDAIDAYRQHRRLIIGHDRDDTIAKAAGDWYRHVAATGDVTSGLLIAADNDTVAQLNEQARSHLAASQRLNGPTLEAGERVFQAGDRILCRNNQSRLDVLNGDLGTVLTVNTDHGALTVRLDRDPETRELPSWYLDEGHVDYGYALTGHKAQGVTTGRTFTVIAGGTDREWAYVAMSRGRHANTLYLADPEPDDEQCTHLTHEDRRDALDALAASLGRSSAHVAAIDHFAGGRPSVGADIDTLGPPPSSSDVAERVAWIVARRRAERDEPERQQPGIQLASGR
ncbi:MAG: AAA family ATPase, partial [Acidobacteria bacterium]|nr:AAA family ATPase [Acidobacteriota bacterium]